MGTVALRARFARGLELARDNAAMLAIFATALFLSALLLFSVQPIFARMVLPKLGGSPAVWAVSMVFFQAVLLAGYAYAHLLNRHCPQRQAPLVHLGLMALAALALPFGLPRFADEPPAGDAYFWLMGVLAAGVGLPFFAVSANAPLLQSWFSRSGHPQASDPYFLYGASNFGSLIALLAYPVAIEPVLGLSRQAGVWTSGFLMLGVLIALCALLVLPARETLPQRGAAATAEASPPVSWQQALGWIWFAGVPSGLLVSYTSYITTDIAAAPFLWVIPLALFLATFILVFRDKPVLPHRILLRVQPLVVTLTLLGLATSTVHSWMLGMIAGFAAFFVTTMVCHKQLYDARPQSRHLTAFYMWMSLGGVMGGMFAALLAPQIFNAIYEFPLLLLAGLASRAGVARALTDTNERKLSLRFCGLALVGVAVLAAIVAAGMVTTDFAGRSVALLMTACGVFALLMSERPLQQVAAVITMAVALLMLPSAMNFGFAERSFFGVHRIDMSADGQYRKLIHGTTLHGAMRVKDAQGNTVAAALPATYYHPASPMAQGVDLARAATGKTDGGLVVGSVGVGTGSMACYARGNERWRFYEIDPVVVKLARDPNLFTYFARCRPDADFVIGDARLTLAREPAGSIDYLIVDAFSSDSIPVHLLTREALQLYLSRLSPNGIVALHVSNRHMDLVDVATNLAHSMPGIGALAVIDRRRMQNFDVVTSHVILFAKSQAVLAPALAWNGARPIAAATGRPAAPWTDDYSNVLGAILKRHGF